MMLPVITSGGEAPLTTTGVTGVAQERVDPRTLQLLDDLFPGHHGLEFAARLLRLAEAKQLALSELGYTDMADVAVITIQSIRALATCIGWSYDTTEKYLVVLCCLRLLYKQRSRHQIVLYFPLRRCQLPEPEALDRLQELRPGKRTPRYREKVRRFASQVKRRFVLLCKGSKTALAISSPAERPFSDASLGVPRLLEDIHLILQQEVDSQTASRLFLKIGGAVHDHWPQRRLSGTKGDADGEGFSFQEQPSPFGFEKDDSGQEAVPHQSRLFSQNGDFGGNALIRHHQESPFSEPKGDSERGSAASESRLFGAKGDFSHEHGVVEGRLQEQKATLIRAKGDFVSEPSTHQSRLLPQKGDSLESSFFLQGQKATFISAKGDAVGTPLTSQRRLSPKKGDFVGAWAGPDEQKATPVSAKGDSVEFEGADREEKSSFGLEKDDFSPTAAGSLNDNDNNTIYITHTEKGDDNVNDPATQINQTPRCSGREAARIGQQLAYFLENGANAGGFVNKVKKCGPMIVQAAVIDLLVHHAFPLVDPTDLRGRPDNKAGWFHGACNHFSLPGASLPAYVTKWLSTGFSWQKIEQELARAAAKYERFMQWEETGNLVRAFLRGEISEQEVDARLIEVEQQHARQVTPGSISEGHLVLDVNQLSMNEAEARLLAKVMPGELEALCDEIAALGGEELPRGATASAKEKQGNVWEVELKWKKLPFPVRFSSLRTWRAYVEEQLEGEKYEVARKAARGN